MPTGYTAAIADGIDFKTYALSCARAFGALVEMRDEPANAPIPEEFKPSSYYVTSLASAREEVVLAKDCGPFIVHRSLACGIFDYEPGDGWQLTHAKTGDAVWKMLRARYREWLVKP